MTNRTAGEGKSPRARLKLTPTERRASITLALLFASRMLGLFLLTPVFAVAALTIPGGNDAAKVGLALGAYGLTQAILQIPLGMASDRWGRRPVIIFGMLLFIIGGVIRSEEPTSELQSLMRISYAVFCLKKKKQIHNKQLHTLPTSNSHPYYTHYHI